MTIRQFDVFRTPLRRDKEQRPYVVVVQAPWIDSASRVCVHLIDERFLQPILRLNPKFVVEERAVYFHPVEILTLGVRMLRDPIANLAAARDRIVPALDLVFTGF
jgi:hypothetical protein